MPMTLNEFKTEFYQWKKNISGKNRILKKKKIRKYHKIK